MTNTSTQSHAASSAADRTLDSLAGPHGKTDAEETEDIALAPSSPRSNEDWEDLMNWDRTDEAIASLKTSVPSPSSTRRCPSASALSLITIAGSNVDVSQASSDSTDSRKRKSSPAIDGKSDAPTGASRIEPLISKRSHNAIEKRYRTNLNQKIAGLRDAVPSLRRLGALAADDADSLTSTHKLNKATILSKAIEYIQHLESRNQHLEEENAILREPVHTMEQEANKSTRAPGEATLEVGSDVANVDLASGSAVTRDSPPAFNDPQGMIRVPEEIRRLREGAPQAHYHERRTRPLPASGGIEIYLGAMLRMP